MYFLTYLKWTKLRQIATSEATFTNQFRTSFDCVITKQTYIRWQLFRKSFRYSSGRWQLYSPAFGSNSRNRMILFTVLHKPTIKTRSIYSIIYKIAVVTYMYAYLWRDLVSFSYSSFWWVTSFTADSNKSFCIIQRFFILEKPRECLFALLYLLVREQRDVDFSIIPPPSMPDHSK